MTIDPIIIPPHANESGRPSPAAAVRDSDDFGISPSDVRVVSAAMEISEALPGLVKHEGTALILDINNLYLRARENRFNIDYNLLKMIFEQRCDLRHCAAFSAIDRQNVKSRKWVDYMIDKGYRVVTKDLKRYINGQGNPVTKGNMDIEIAIEALSLSTGFAHVILGTCDGDFVPLVEKLREGHFRKVSVLGMTNASSYSGMSDSLIRSADYFYDMFAIRDHIRYDGPNDAR